jgi:fructokinase
MFVCSIGEVLWDIFPDKEMFGGAPLNFCANLQRLGNRALLLGAVGKDERGQLALERMRLLGLSTDGMQQVAGLPTGVATISTSLDGEVSFVIPRPAAFDALSVSVNSVILAEIKAIGLDWVYFGTLLQTKPEIERLTSDLVKSFRPARCFYDMNLRTGQWNFPLVQRLSKLASVVKLNECEARTLFNLMQKSLASFSVEEFCRIWASTYDVDVICLTLGAGGCIIFDRGTIYRVAGYQVIVCDTVGSGDAFAAAFLHGYDHGWPISQTASFANALGALVATRAGATPDWTIDEVLALTSHSQSEHSK